MFPFRLWLSSLFGNTRKPSRRQRRAGRVPAPMRRRVRPRLETLEDRVTPSGYDILAFTGINSFQGTAPNGPSGAISVQLQDTSGHVITPTSNVTVQLSTSSSTGEFLDLSGKALANNSITISAGSSYGLFEYEDSQMGQATIKGQSYNPFAFGGANVNIQGRLAFTTPAQILGPNQASQPITVQLQDANGNAVNATSNVTVNLFSNSSTGKFLDTSGNPLPTSFGSTSLTIAAGSSSASFEYEDSTTGYAFLSASTTGGASTSQTEQIKYSLGYTTPLQVIATGSPSGTITVQLQNGSGQAVTASSAVTIDLSSSSFTGTFLNTLGSPLSGNSITIAAGASSASFEYEDSTTGAKTLTAQTSDFSASATQQVYVGLGITTPAQTITPGKPSGTITVQLGSTATSAVTLDLTSSSATGEFLDTSGNLLPTSNGLATLTIAVGSSSASFEYEDSTTGLPIITAETSDFSEEAQQQENVGGISLKYTTAPQTVALGQPSGTITVQLQDSSGNPFTVANSTFVQLSSSSGGQFLDTSGNPIFGSVTIAANSSSASFEYENQYTSGLQSVTASIASSIPGGAPLSATQQETVTSSSSFSSVVFVSPEQSIAAGQKSQPITVQLQNNGSAFTATSAVTLNLSSSSTTGKFFDTSGNAITSITIAAGSSSASFEYEDSQEWVPTLTATVSGGTFVAGSQTVNIGGVTLAYTTAAQTITAGTPSGIITVQLQDSSGNAVTAPIAESFSLTSNSQTGQFLDTTGKPLASPSVTIAANSNSASFEYEDTVGGKPTLTASTYYPFSLSATQQETVTGPYNVAFESFGQQTIKLNQPQPITLQLVDSTGLPATASSAVIVSLSSSSSGGKFLDSSGNPLSGNSITIAAGSGSASFEYEDSQSGLPTLTASENGVKATQTVNVGVSLAFTTSAQTLTAGQTSGTVTVQLQDSSGHAFAAPSDMTISFDSSLLGVQFLDTSGNPLTSTEQTISKGSSSVSFEFKSTWGGTPTLYAYAYSPTNYSVSFSASQQETVQGISSLVFTTAAQTLAAGQTSGTVTVQLQDNNGNVVNAPAGGLTIDLGTGYSYSPSDNSSTKFFDTNGNLLPSNTITMAAGASTASFKFETTTAGASPIEVSVPNGFNATQSETIQAGPPSSVVFLTPAQNMPTGSPSGSISVELEDQYGNAVTAGSSGVTLNLSSSSATGEFLSYSGDPMANPSITIDPGFSENAFEYEDSQAGTPTLTATVAPSGVAPSLSPSVVLSVSGKQQETITPSSAEIHVTNTNDSGDGSLRAAITEANNNPGSTIVFDANVTGTIDLQSELPDILSNTYILGPGANVLTIEASALAAGSFNGLTVGISTSVPFTPPEPIVTISGLTVANFKGTGITNYGYVTLRQVDVSNNQAPPFISQAQTSSSAYTSFFPYGPPGGIGNVGTLTVLDSTIANNSTTNNAVAAGIDSEDGSVLVVNSTVTGNVDNNSNSAGGIGIYGGTAFILNSTISGNTATQQKGTPNNSGGGIDVPDGVALFNTIVAGNTGSVNNPTDVSGFFVSLGYNLIGEANSKVSFGFVGTDQVGTTTNPIDPKLGLLTNNGGPTPTMTLLTGSPAIAAGDNAGAPATDQRGDPRPTQGAIDIGAVEVTTTPDTISLLPGSLSPATVGVSYSQSITASGGVGTLTLTTNPTTLSLPAGLTYSINGSTLTISGKPTASGTVSFSVTADDTSGDTMTRNYTLTVNTTGTPITLSPSAGTLPSATVGTSYSQTITASGGVGTLNLTDNLPANTLGLNFSINGSTLTISGKPTGSGTLDFTVTSSDNSGDTTGAQSYALTVNAASTPITLSPSAGALPSATAGTSYSQTITASGGSGTLNVTDNLPANTLGLSFAISGSTLTISGTPTGSGTVDFSVTASDNNGDTTGAQSYTLTVNPAGTITLSPAAGTLPPATAGTSYSQTITASGGGGTLNVTDNLPANTLGLNFAISGSTLTISGTPTASGTVNFTITASDNFGDTTGAQSYTLTVNPVTITLSPAAGALPSGTAGTSYNQSITASGGSGTLNVTDNVPANTLGLNFAISDNKLTISGTPTASGTVNFTVSANDGFGDATGPQSYTLTVNPVTITLSPASGPLPSGTEGFSYSQSITASGGVGTLTLTTNPASVTLPAGLQLSINGSTLTISGKPTASGNASFSVTAKDGFGDTTTQNYTLAVNAAAAPSIIDNPSSQTVTAGQSVSLSAAATGAPTPMVQWQISTDGGATFSNIDGARSTTLTLSNVTTSMSGNQYRAVFSNGVGNDATTSAATLTVNAPPLPVQPPPTPPAPVLNPPPLLTFFNSLFGGGTEVVNPDGSVTVTDSFLGFPFFVSNFDSSGHLENVELFGFIDITFLFMLFL